jgi:large subunit ribosomal protein L10
MLRNSEDNIKQILSKAAQSSRSVALEVGYITDENKEEILQKGHAQAQGLAGKAKDYKPE